MQFHCCLGSTLFPWCPFGTSHLKSGTRLRSGPLFGSPRRRLKAPRLDWRCAYSKSRLLKRTAPSHRGPEVPAPTNDPAAAPLLLVARPGTSVSLTHPLRTGDCFQRRVSRRKAWLQLLTMAPAVPGRRNPRSFAGILRGCSAVARCRRLSLAGPGSPLSSGYFTLAPLPMVPMSTRCGSGICRGGCSLPRVSALPKIAVLCSLGGNPRSSAGGLAGIHPPRVPGVVRSLDSDKARKRVASAGRLALASLLVDACAPPLAVLWLRTRRRSGGTAAKRPICQCSRPGRRSLNRVHRQRLAPASVSGSHRAWRSR